MFLECSVLGAVVLVLRMLWPWGVGIAIIGVCEVLLAYWPPFREFPAGVIC